MKKNCVILFLLGWIPFVTVSAGVTQGADPSLEQARLLFYQSVEEERNIDPALKLFQQINEQDSTLAGRSLTYIGALTALKGKHALLPQNKLKWVKNGLALMDRGVAMNPDDIESLFIHGSTCFFLPFFFNRSEDAQEKLRRIVELLPTENGAYDAALLNNVIDFVEQNTTLSDAEKEILATAQKDIMARTSTQSKIGQVQ
ncbi:MAG: hypothetical protein ACOY90_21235 [Candidatus Zhuqueibacterota bacterium]